MALQLKMWWGDSEISKCNKSNFCLVTLLQFELLPGIKHLDIISRHKMLEPHKTKSCGSSDLSPPSYPSKWKKLRCFLYFKLSALEAGWMAFMLFGAWCKILATDARYSGSGSKNEHVRISMFCLTVYFSQNSYCFLFKIHFAYPRAMYTFTVRCFLYSAKRKTLPPEKKNAILILCS